MHQLVGSTPSIKAPSKKYLLLDRVGHAPKPLMVDAQYRALETQIEPLIRE